MKKIIKLTESKIISLIKRVISEESQGWGLSYARDIEVTKYQKNSNAPECKPCTLTVTGSLKGDFDKKTFCVNKKLYHGTWDCPEGYGLESVITKEYGVTNDSDRNGKNNVDYYIKRLPSENYEDFLSKLKDPHVLLTIMAIGTAFIPMVGPFLSAGFGLGDAGLYYKEGKNKEAGLVALMSVLPFVGILGKIGLKGVSPKTFTTIGEKLATNSKVTKIEADIIEKVVQNKDEVIKAVNTYSKANQIGGKLPAETGVLKVVGTVGAYAGAAQGYNKTYDYYYNKNTLNQEKENIESLEKLLTSRFKKN